MLESIALNPDTPPENCIIWLHGLGADGSDFVPVARQMQLQAPCRYIFPHAPVRPVGINNGMEMRAWYDIDASGNSTLQDIMQSVHEVQAILDDQIAQGLPANRILLAGFSQGGVIAQHLALRYNQKLAGLLALSTYLPHLTESQPELQPCNETIPYMVMHGTADPMIPLQQSRNNLQALQALGYRFDWKEYHMGHAVCPEQISDIENWLNQVLLSS